MGVYHVSIEKDEDWYVGTVLDRRGITTQGRTIDELVLMVRDAIKEMYGDTEPHLELVVTPAVSVPISVLTTETESPIT